MTATAHTNAYIQHTSLLCLSIVKKNFSAFHTWEGSRASVCVCVCVCRSNYFNFHRSALASVFCLDGDVCVAIQDVCTTENNHEPKMHVHENRSPVYNGYL